jgi:hypothetical protein
VEWAQSGLFHRTLQAKEAYLGGPWALTGRPILFAAIPILQVFPLALTAFLQPTLNWPIMPVKKPLFANPSTQRKDHM